MPRLPRRLHSLFGLASAESSTDDSPDSAAVRRILQSRSRAEVLCLGQPQGTPGSDATGSRSSASARSSATSTSEHVTDADHGALTRDDRSAVLLEAGLAGTPGGADFNMSPEAVLKAFLMESVKVHPACNAHEDALLALRWVVDAFVHLRNGATNSAWNDIDSASASVHELPCSTDADQALQIFGDAVALANASLSLSGTAPGQFALGKPGADALLRAMYILHLQDPFAASNTTPEIEARPERSMLDSVLAGALAANWVLTGLARLMPRRRRPRAEWFCTTIIAAVGGVAFNGVGRISRMLAGPPPRVISSSGQGLLEGSLGVSPLAATLLVQCPLCRTMSSAGQAIRNVRAGEAVPACCVCTEAPSNVCLPCGHLCLCQDCFSQMPRTTAVPS